MEKLLIICRHGEYDRGTHHLNEYGKDQIIALASHLQPIIEDRTIRILSSTADRALESAEILRGAFKTITVERHELLWSESRRRPDYEGTKHLVEEAFLASDTVILVTHLEYTDGFTEYFIKQSVGKQLASFELRKGQARITSADGETDYAIIPLRLPKIVVTKQDEVAPQSLPPTPRQEETTIILEDGDNDFPF